MTPAQFVPESEVTLDVQVFGHAPAVGGFVGPPIQNRLDVEVLPIEVNALLRDHPVHMFGEPLPRLVIAEVQQAALGAA